MSTHLVFSCCHAHPDHSNERADYLGRLIADVKPDVVVNLGDAVDLPSLSSFEKGRKGFKGLTYERDITSHIDFQTRLWSPTQLRKKKLPHRVVLHGNHEQRIQTALDLQPELDGAIGFRDLQLSDWYDNIVPYEGTTPGTIEIDGVTYAHYFTSGALGRPISSEHMGYTMVSKGFTSCTAGHTHSFDMCIRSRADGSKLLGCVVGCYQDYTNDWAGEIAKLWDRGVVIKRNVSGGSYDFEWVSLETLKATYAEKTEVL